MTGLKKQRLKKGMSQEELSRKSGVSVYTIRSYEQNQKDINKAQLNTILRLIKALKCEISDILEGADEV